MTKLSELSERGSTELVVIGLVVSFILLASLPFLNDIGDENTENIRQLCMYTHGLYNDEDGIVGADPCGVADIDLCVGLECQLEL